VTDDVKPDDHCLDELRNAGVRVRGKPARICRLSDDRIAVIMPNGERQSMISFIPLSDATCGLNSRLL